MCIEELTKKAQASIGNTTHEQRVEMLRDAKIIDESGYFHPDYFSKETVEKDKANGHPVIL